MPRRILVKEVNWLGDVVMSLPALAAVRRAYPDAHLAVLVRAELASFFAGSSWVDEVVPYSVAAGLRGLADRFGVVRRIRAGRFDLAVLLPRSFQSALWVALAGVPERAGFVADGRGMLLTRRARRSPDLRRRHQMNDYLAMLRQTLGIEAESLPAVPDVHEPYRAAMAAWLASRRRRPQGKLVALAVAAAYGPAKEWPVAHFAETIDRLERDFGAECVLVGAPGERGKSEEVARATRGGALVAAGQTSVGEAVALLSLCDGFAGNDSGSMHVAAALGVPAVGIFGSTNPHRTGPLGPKTAVLHESLPCSPCLERTCRFGHYDCLRRITAPSVVEALRRLGALGG